MAILTLSAADDEAGNVSAHGGGSYRAPHRAALRPRSARSTPAASTVTLQKGGQLLDRLLIATVAAGEAPIPGADWPGHRSLHIVLEPGRRAPDWQRAVRSDACAAFSEPGSSDAYHEAWTTAEYRDAWSKWAPDGAADDGQGRRDDQAWVEPRDQGSTTRRALRPSSRVHRAL